MPDSSRVVTANLPADLVARLDQTSGRLERSKSWIIRQALAEWLAEEHRRHELTLEALEEVDRGDVITAEEMAIWAKQQKGRS